MMVLGTRRRGRPPPQLATAPGMPRSSRTRKEGGRSFMPIVQSRRRFLTNLTGAVGLGGVSVAGLGGGRKSLAAEPPLEVATIRFGQDLGTCIAPQVFEELL